MKWWEKNPWIDSETSTRDSIALSVLHMKMRSAFSNAARTWMRASPTMLWESKLPSSWLKKMLQLSRFSSVKLTRPGSWLRKLRRRKRTRVKSSLIWSRKSLTSTRLSSLDLVYLSVRITPCSRCSTKKFSSRSKLRTKKSSSLSLSNSRLD